MAPKLAPCLVRLRNDINKRWPNRSKTSDGWLGDSAHAARKSEHNPDSKGMVHAIDVDKDGVDPDVILKAVIKHPAIWYVIWDGYIYSRTNGWTKKKYNGTNQHKGHLHISCLLTSAAENNKTPFGINVVALKPTVKTYTIKRGDTLSEIAKKYNTTWEKLHKLNAKVIGTNPNAIQIGTVLILP